MLLFGNGHMRVTVAEIKAVGAYIIYPALRIFLKIVEGGFKAPFCIKLGRFLCGIFARYLIFKR